jgi:predicted nucleotidyltransferase
MGKRDALKEFVLAVNKRYPLRFAVLFGSRARGDALKSSDYDILLVSEYFKGNVIQRISEVLKLWKEKEALEPICFTLEEFEAGTRGYNTIVWESLKEGKPIYGANEFMKYKAVFEKAKRLGLIEALPTTIRFKKSPESIFG